MSRSLEINRRDWLKAATGLVVSFTFSDGLSALLQQPPVAIDGRTLDSREVDGFLSIAADGSVTVYTSKVDVGTGMRIAVAQMAAEELGVDTSRVSVVDGDTGQCPNTGGTGGSTGLTRGGTAVRQAAATARKALLALAAERLKRPATELTIVGGEVRPIGSGKGVGIGALVANRRLAVAVDPKAPLVNPTRYSRVGQSPRRPDVPAKCTGRYKYIQDFSLSGMLHGRVIRPPAIGATLLSVDEASVAHLPDVRVLRVGSFLAVVAADEWAAIRGARELKASWTEWSGLSGHENLERYLREGVVDRDQAIVHRGPTGPVGDADPSASALEAALASAPLKLSATYFWPCQSHASLAPSCAVADVKGDGATIWTSSQVTFGMRATLSRVFGLVPEKVRVVFVEGSGSYGTNGADHAAADAVLLSKTIGKPVRVQWTRQDEHAWDPKGPQQLLDLRAGLDASGHIVAWDTQMWIPANRRGARILLAAQAAGLPQDNGRDAAGIFENGDPAYAADHVRVLAHWMRDTPLNPSNLRAPGKPANVFAVEGFTDEIAAALRVDPLEFRMQRLSDPRALEVLTRGAKAFGWQSRPSPNAARPATGPLVGRGVAYTRYKQAENYLATFMEVAVDRETGKITVRRVVCAHDCGLVVNPDALRNQIEGGIVQTLSRALHEEVQFDASRVTSVDWGSYPILTFPEAPEVEVILVSRPEEPLWGAGEASTVTVAAALANAIFDATAVRLRRAPFRGVRP
jgi:CO/xanthine dehydrogenase Mo-binding subunit